MAASGTDDGPPLRLVDWLGIAVVCGLGLWAQQVAGDPDANLWRTTPADAPLVRRLPGLSNATFAAVARCATENALLDGAQPLTDNFASTRGLMARFTRAGLADVRADSRLACFLPFIEHVMDTACDAFVLNVVDAVPTDPEAEDPIRWHIDQSFPLSMSIGHYVAHTVSVLYVRVPFDMVGGELELRKVPDDWLDEHGLRARALFGNQTEGLLAATIAPAENDLITFRGDAHHRVLPFSSSDAGARRVSVVLEQYSLPRFGAWRARRFFLR